MTLLVMIIAPIKAMISGEYQARPKGLYDDLLDRFVILQALADEDAAPFGQRRHHRLDLDALAAVRILDMEAHPVAFFFERRALGGIVGPFIQIARELVIFAVDQQVHFVAFFILGDQLLDAVFDAVGAVFAVFVDQIVILHVDRIADLLLQLIHGKRIDEGEEQNHRQREQPT